MKRVLLGFLLIVMNIISMQTMDYDVMLINKSIIIKEAKDKDDINFLWEMLYEAATSDPEIQKIGKAECLKNPAINKYLINWGKKGDFALIAFDTITNLRIGAAWYQLFTSKNPGYGYIAEDIPEISIAVIPARRGTGIGSILLEALIKKAKEQGFKALSLSVEKDNKAKFLYDKFGFKDAGISQSSDSSVTMKLVL